MEGNPTNEGEKDESVTDDFSDLSLGDAMSFRDFRKVIEERRSIGEDTKIMEELFEKALKGIRKK